MITITSRSFPRVFARLAKLATDDGTMDAVAGNGFAFQGTRADVEATEAALALDPNADHRDHAVLRAFVQAEQEYLHSWAPPTP